MAKLTKKAVDEAMAAVEEALGNILEAAPRKLKKKLLAAYVAIPAIDDVETEPFPLNPHLGRIGGHLLDVIGMTFHSPAWIKEGDKLRKGGV